MPRRAIISSLLVLIGTLSGSAATLNLTTRNTGFQPHSTLHPAVIQPAQAKVISRKARLTSQGAQKIAPVWRTPAQIKMGRMAFNQPGHAAVRPAVSQVATGN